jgi:lipopolysaccharide biosynthesis regulator YciM
MWEWLFLLLPVAAFSGWYIARKQYQQQGSTLSSGLNPAYFKGLNYLLDEQPDKAIDVFIGLLEVNSETVETHLALANLFRRRGETDRAIRIHQNLIARPTLSPSQRVQALLELGLDYMTAGVLDRAEQLFLEVMEHKPTPVEAPKQLVKIYQQGKKWPQAIEMAKQVPPDPKIDTRALIAQFYCEIATPMLEIEGQQAIRMLKQAQQYDPNCVRASLLEGRTWLQLNAPRKAIRALERVESQDLQFLSEALPLLLRAYTALDDLKSFQIWLSKLLDRHPHLTSARLLYTRLLQQQSGREVAQTYLYNAVHDYPSVEGLHQLIQLGEQPHHDLMPLIKEVTTVLVHRGDRYNCKHCGFAGRTLHWLCPGCGKWATMQPVEIHLSALEKLLERS